MFLLLASWTWSDMPAFSERLFPRLSKVSIWSLMAAEQREIAASQAVPMITCKSVLWWSLQKLCIIDLFAVRCNCNFSVLVVLLLPHCLFHFGFCGVLLSKQSTVLLTVLGMCWLLNNHKWGRCAKFGFGVTVFSASRPWCSSRKIKVFMDALWISTLAASPL